MKKFACAAIAVLMIGSIATAADLNVVLDIRGNTTGIDSITTPAAPFTLGQDANGTAINGGGLGEGQILRLNPAHSNNWNTTFGAVGYPNFDGDGDLATGSFWVYATMTDKAGDGDVLSSFGVDFMLQDSAATGSDGSGHRIGSIAHTFTNLSIWSTSGTVDGASDLANPPSIIGAKAVNVPVAAGTPPTYNASAGLTPASGMTQISRVDIAAGSCVPAASLANSTFELYMNVNGLLITRAFDPANPGTGPEMVSFGYDSLGADYAAATGAEDAAISGSAVGASTLPDGIVRIQVKGDYNGSGTVTSQDIPALQACLTGALQQTQSLVYLYDFNNSGNVTAQDIPGFQAILMGNAPVCP